MYTHAIRCSLKCNASILTDRRRFCSIGLKDLLTKHLSSTMTAAVCYFNQNRVRTQTFLYFVLSRHCPRLLSNDLTRLLIRGCILAPNQIALLAGMQPKYIPNLKNVEKKVLV